MPARGASETLRWVAEFEERLRAHARPERAGREQAYLKSDLEFIGAGMPAIRAVTRAWEREHPLDRAQLVALVRALWVRGVHELRGVAIVLLQRQKRLLNSDDLVLIEGLIRDSGTWAYVDSLAGDVAGALVEHEPALASTLDRWAEDSDFWVRRAALLGPIRRGGGDFERFARYADTMIEEREFFIRKAIGWVLREASKLRPALVAEWLLPRAARASGVTVREAVKYLDAASRQRIVEARQGRARQASEASQGA